MVLIPELENPTVPVEQARRASGIQLMTEDLGTVFGQVEEFETAEGWVPGVHAAIPRSSAPGFAVRSTRNGPETLAAEAPLRQGLPDLPDSTLNVLRTARAGQDRR